MLITVPEAANKIGKNPETVRRWIRKGRLRSQKIGSQHLIEESDLELVSGGPASFSLPEALRQTLTGEKQPDWGTAVRGLRDSS